MADTLAKTGLAGDSSFILFESSPSFISIALMADSAGTSFPRGF